MTSPRQNDVRRLRRLTAGLMARQLAPQPRAPAARRRTPPARRLHASLGLLGAARHLHVPSTCRRRGSAPRLHFAPTSLALIATYSTLHETHLAVRAAPISPRSTPIWSSEAEGSASNALSCTCNRGQTRVVHDLWRKRARKGEWMRYGEVGVGSTNDIESLHRLDQRR